MLPILQEIFHGFVITNNVGPYTGRLSQPKQVVFFDSHCINIVPDAIECLTEVISKCKEDLISRFGRRCDFIRPEKVA